MSLDPFNAPPQYEIQMLSFSRSGRRFPPNRDNLFGARAGKERTMEHAQLQLSGGVRYRNRE